MKRLSRQLLSKSQEAFVLAIEVFNKPTIRYRLEGFCFFFVNAWELLLKARLIEMTRNTAAIFETAHAGESGLARQSIRLAVAITKVLPSNNDPVRKNLERLADLRNAAAHLVIPELEPIYGGLIQAGVINYVNALNDWFALKITDRITPGMLSLVFDLQNLDPVLIKQRYGREVLEFVKQQQSLVQGDLSLISDLRFSIPVSYRLALVKNPSVADIVLSSGSAGEHAGVVLEVAKDIDRTHPLLQKEVVLLVQERLGAAIRFTTHDFQAILHKEQLRAQNNKFYYLITKPKTSRYSESLADHIVHQIMSHSDYLDRAREAYSTRNKKFVRRPGAMRPTATDSLLGPRSHDALGGEPSG